MNTPKPHDTVSDGAAAAERTTLPFGPISRVDLPPDVQATIMDSMKASAARFRQGKLAVANYGWTIPGTQEDEAASRRTLEQFAVVLDEAAQDSKLNLPPGYGAARISLDEGYLPGALTIGASSKGIEWSDRQDIDSNLNRMVVRANELLAERGSELRIP